MSQFNYYYSEVTQCPVSLGTIISSPSILIYKK